MEITQARLDTLDFAIQLSEVRDILNRVEIKDAKVTFWGTRVIQIDGEEFSLNEIAEKIAKAAYQRYEATNLTKEERLAGMGISMKINEFYYDTGEVAGHANFFTKLIFWLRECNCFFGNSTCDLFDSGMVGGYFRSYTEAQFEQAFPEESFECYDPKGTPPRVKAWDTVIKSSAT